MRKILLLITVLCILSTTLVFGDSKNPKIYVDNKLVQMEGDVQNYRGATYVPLNFVKSGFDATVNWTSPNATVKKGDTTLVFTVNSNAYTNNGKTFYSEFQPYISDGLVYVPLKIVTANLGASVSQNSETKDLYIDTKKAGSLANPYIDYNDAYTLSNDNKYGYCLINYSYNGTNEHVIFLKNIETGEFKEIFSNFGREYLYWTNDNKLIISCETYSNNKLVKTDISLYDPVTNKTTVIASGTDALYIQSNDSMIYKNNSKFYKYDFKTNKSTTITEQEYNTLAENQNKLSGSGVFYNVYIDDKLLTLDPPPENHRGSTYVPVSFISKELGFDVSWTSPYITIKDDNTTIVLEVGSNAYTKNGVTYYTQYQPYISNGRTYVPLRFISNLFGYAVGYSETSTTVNNQRRTTHTITIDTTKQVIPDNSFVDDNSTFILSPSKKYGYKNGGASGEMIIYVKNMQTGEFKEVYHTVASEYSAWLYNDKLLLRGTYDAYGNDTGDQFLLYDPTTDTLSNLAKARYGDYVEPLDIFVYSTTEYRSDATSDEGSTFYAKDMKTGKVKTITKDEFYNYLDMEEQYRKEHYTYPY